MHKNKHATLLQGTPLVAGIAVGQIWIPSNRSDFNQIHDHKIANSNQSAEKQSFLDAIEQTHIDIAHLLKKTDYPVYKELLEAYLAIIQSPHLQKTVHQYIYEGYSADVALKKAIQNYALHFEQIDQEHIKARIVDLFDLARKILTHIEAQQQSNTIKNSGSNITKIIQWPKETIVWLNEGSITHLMEIPRACLKGIILAKTSVYSHIVIIAKTLGIPIISDVELPPEIHTGAQVILNANKDNDIAQVSLFPSDKMLKEAREQIKQQAANNKTKNIDIKNKLKQEAKKEREENWAVKLYINADIYSDITQALQEGAQGIGLYRSEIAFMRADHILSEIAQYEIYRELLTQGAPHPVYIRVLDISEDKPLTALKAPPGLQGIRLLLAYPDVFLTQLRALLCANAGLNNLHIVLPMVMSASDIDQAGLFIKQAYKQVCEQNKHIQYPPVGAMIESTEAVLEIEAITERVDFVSVGTNDLTHSLLLSDRYHKQSSGSVQDGLHPIVLDALHKIIQVAHHQNKKVSICGEMASDPIAAIVLLGLDFDILSVQAHCFITIQWLVSHLNLTRAHNIVQYILSMQDIQQAQVYLESTLSKILETRI